MSRLASPIRRVTLHDVARHCDVSYQTVSRVVNNDPHVAKETRRRVLRAIKELNYQPNRVARSLVTQRSNLIEVITFGGQHYGPAQMVTHVEQAARQRGYNLILTNITRMTLEEIQAAIHSLSGRLIDGFILVTPVVGVGYEELAEICGNIPFVMIDAPQQSTAPSVVINQRYGSQLATQHLIDLGHREICEISGPMNWHGAVARHESWQQTLEAAAITPGLSVEGNWTPIGGYEATCRLLASGAHFTGLVVGNDQMALGAMRALREHHLRIPEDISVVGFDDIPEAICFEPPLTTVHQDFAALGRQAVEYLLDLMNRVDTPLQQRVLYPSLVERQSTRHV
ncbi:MAG TPA: LacI family DNA-binding transcriptional regulator [Phototrophicaceae bacterium]|nr:LacI family DNA-binding transcriptional regulator [Phototrophicaceae bacterium]